MGDVRSEGTRRILSGEIKDALEGVKKLSFCVLEQSRAIRDFFLGEPPEVSEKDSPPRETGGYFRQVKNELDDVYRFLRDAFDSLVVVGKEIGVDPERPKVSERPSRIV